MSTDIDYLGIDFGTTNSTFAGWDADGAAARVLRDAEGQDKTPSMVYFGEGETLVGVLAENMLADGRGRPEVTGRIVRSVKRNLLSPPWIALPGGRSVRPVDVSAEILAKLKHDAEHSNGQREIARAVITCPAMFGGTERTVLTDAATEAGFTELELLEEPRAAALAFARGDEDIGNGVLVYDYGGGTFDAAFVAREGPGEVFELAIDPEGDLRCGGDDLDQQLYDYWDAEARRELGRGITLEDGRIDLGFLRQCRRRKENLSKTPQETFSTLLEGGVQFRSHVDRATFEDLIRADVDRTVRITEHMAQRARDEGYDVDMILLVGGSSQIPLVKQRLREVLDLPLASWRLRDVAVAMGAAEYASVLWQPRQSTRDRYRRAVALAWKSEQIEEPELEQLGQLGGELGLTADARAEIESEVIGARKEQVFYGAAVATAWAARPLGPRDRKGLEAMARRLGLEQHERLGAERRVMGKTLAQVFTPAEPTKPPKPKPPAAQAAPPKPATPPRATPSTSSGSEIPWWVWVLGAIVVFVFFGDEIVGCAMPELPEAPQ